MRLGIELTNLECLGNKMHWMTLESEIAIPALKKILRGIRSKYARKTVEIKIMNERNLFSLLLGEQDYSYPELMSFVNAMDIVYWCMFRGMCYEKALTYVEATNDKLYVIPDGFYGTEA